MPITGRSIAGAGLMGLGEGLQKWSDQTIKRKQIADEWAFELKKQKLQQEAAQEGKQQEALQKLLESTVANPGSVDAQLRMASIMMPNRLSPEAADQVRQIAEQTGTQHLLHQLGTTKNPADFPPDLAQALSQNTGRDFGSRPPTVDAAQWGGAAPDWGGPPALLQAINIERQRRAQLDQEEQDKIAQLGKQKEAEAYGTATGTATATHEGAPRLTQDQIDAINAKSGPNAAAAGATKHAEEMAGVAPDVTQGKAAQTTAVAGAGLTPELQRLRAQQAGAVAGATEAAEAPYHPTML